MKLEINTNMMKWELLIIALFQKMFNIVNTWKTVMQ